MTAVRKIIDSNVLADIFDLPPLLRTGRLKWFCFRRKKNPLRWKRIFRSRKLVSVKLNDIIHINNLTK
jgi:hypothetical protein